MVSALFQSGRWVGYFGEAEGAQDYMMNLAMEFEKGEIDGEGEDYTGYFIVSGTYDLSSGLCEWNKIYVGRDTIRYQGSRENLGIRGVWTVKEKRGTFHIWPWNEGSTSDPSFETASLNWVRAA